jgi:putative tryptophan/tyrosine transport system substrate-binding protein
MAIHIRRREFIVALGSAAATWPFAAGAQQAAIPVVGFIHIMSAENVPHIVASFRQGLREAGLVEGQNVRVEYRWAEGNYDRLPDLAADLVRRQVAVIAAAGGEPSPQAAKAATQTIPIVFTAAGDPVADGLVASLNRPGGNATGITIFGGGVVTKRLQLLREIVPKAGTTAYLMNPSNPNAEIEMRAAQAAAACLGQQNDRGEREQRTRTRRRIRGHASAAPARFSSPPTRSSFGNATGSPRWPRVIGYRRCLTCANLRTLAV